MQRSGRGSSRRTAGLAVLSALTTVSWLVFRHLGDLPSNDTPEGEAGEVVGRPSLSWLYYWGHHTSTWWAAQTAVLGTVTSAVLGAWLLRLAVRSTFARSKVAGALVAVVGWSAWFCGAAFLTLLALALWFTASLEGTQTEVTGPDGRHVLVTLDNSGYHRVRVWRQDTATPLRGGAGPGRGRSQQRPVHADEAGRADPQVRHDFPDVEAMIGPAPGDGFRPSYEGPSWRALVLVNPTWCLSRCWFSDVRR